MASRSLSSAEVDGCVVCPGVCYYGACIVPAPPPLLPNISDPYSDWDSTPIEIHHPNRLLPNFLIAAGALLALSFFLLLLSYTLLRLRRRRRQQELLHGAAPHPPPPPQNEADGADLIEDEDDGAPHHIWYIRTVGLDESVIKSIAAIVYRSKDGLIDDGDCSVCLGEFSEGDAVKLLPKCSHAFHLSCIDTWLRSHVNCPLCRAPVVAPPAESDDSGPPESASVEISVPNQEECVIDVDEGAGSSSGSRREEEMQPVRRSVSMDSSALGMLMLGVKSESEEKMGEERKDLELEGAVVQKNRGKWGEILGKRNVEMKRSLSSRSGRLFFQRIARGRSASVLPL